MIKYIIFSKLFLIVIYGLFRIKLSSENSHKQQTKEMANDYEKYQNKIKNYNNLIDNNYHR